MVTTKIAESLTSRSTIGDLRRKCDAYEEDVEKWKRKTQMLQKMCQDLNTVMKRYIIDVQNKQDNPTPIKITRSVGLQVVTDRTRRPGPASATTPSSSRPSPSTSISRSTPTSTAKPASTVQTASPLTPASSMTAKIITSPKTPTFTPIAPKTTIITPQPTTVIKAASPARLQALPSSVSVIPQQQATTTTTTANGSGSQKVIDVVDIDSDEEDDKSKKGQTPNNGLRMVPASKLRSNLVQVNPAKPAAISVTQVSKPILKHPAPLPEPPKFQISGPNMKGSPPKPTLKISRLTEGTYSQSLILVPTFNPNIYSYISGIILSWNMNLNLTIHATIQSYQIYAYQERANSPVVSTLWKKVGDVKALDLPMACTLTQFSKGNKYHFAVRARDSHGRVGSFSDALSISLT